MQIDELARQSPGTATAPVERADALVLFGATGDLARKKLFFGDLPHGRVREPRDARGGHRPVRVGQRALPRHVAAAIDETVQDVDPIIVDGAARPG